MKAVKLKNIYIPGSVITSVLFCTVSLQLIDFQWKLGMAVSSDSCKSLKYPYVAVLLKVADHSGQIKNKSFEMTIPQFQNFYRQFKEIAAVIETV